MTRVVVAGASGFIGRHLVARYRAAGVDVRTIGRGKSADASWGDAAAIVGLVDGCDVLVNLAVGGKWPGPPAARRLPARLQIEYIRVWQH